MMRRLDQEAAKKLRGDMEGIKEEGEVMGRSEEEGTEEMKVMMMVGSRDNEVSPHTVYR